LACIGHRTRPLPATASPPGRREACRGTLRPDRAAIKPGARLPHAVRLDHHGRRTAGGAR